MGDRRTGMTLHRERDVVRDVIKAIDEWHLKAMDVGISGIKEDVEFAAAHQAKALDEGKKARIKELEGKVSALETENAELKRDIKVIQEVAKEDE